MIVFLGLLYSPEDENRILKYAKSSFQSAANNFQWGILNGIHQGSQEKVVVVNSVPMGSYPRHSKILFEKDCERNVNGIKLISCGYINLPVIKQRQRSRSAYKVLKKLIASSDENITVITYSLYLPYVKALRKLKKKNCNFTSVVLIPDLPGRFGIMSANPIKRCIEKKNAKTVFDLLRYTDAFVLLTDQMRQALDIGQKPHTVVEGVYNGSVTEELQSIGTASGEKTVLYTGTLDKALGIETLLDAFERLPSGLAQLKIAGGGNYAEELKRRCESNPNIQYLGFVSKEEVKKLQSEAYVLVNPRSAKEEYTKYSFPSKTMEYLASGKPVVMNKLAGIPSEYYEHIYFTETDDTEGLAVKLLDVLQIDPVVLQERGRKAQTFIREEKNGATQAKKILDLMKSL